MSDGRRATTHSRADRRSPDHGGSTPHRGRDLARRVHAADGSNRLLRQRHSCALPAARDTRERCGECVGEPSGIAFDPGPAESSGQGQRHLRRNPAVGCRARAERCRSRGVRAGNRRTPLRALAHRLSRRRAARRLQHLVDAQRHHDGAHRRDADASLLCADALSLGGTAQGRERSGRASGASLSFGASRTSSTIWSWSTSPRWDSRSAFRLRSGRATRRR